MYYYFTNLASFRTLASLKILKIAKTSSIPPSSCLQPHHIIDSQKLFIFLFQRKPLKVSTCLRSGGGDDAKGSGG